MIWSWLFYHLYMLLLLNLLNLIKGKELVESVPT